MFSLALGFNVGINLKISVTQRKVFKGEGTSQAMLTLFLCMNIKTH